MNCFKQCNIVLMFCGWVWVFKIMAVSPIDDIFMPRCNPPWMKRDSCMFFLLRLYLVETRVCCWMMKTLFVTAHSCRLTVRLKLDRRNYMWWRFNFLAFQCTDICVHEASGHNFHVELIFFNEITKGRALLQDLLKQFLKPGLELMSDTHKNELHMSFAARSQLICHCSIDMVQHYWDV